MDDSRTYARTHYEALLDVRYAACFDRMNERFYRRVRTLIGLTQAVLGAGAVATWLGNAPGLAASAAVLTALAGALDYVISPAERAARFNDQYRRYMALDERAGQLSLEELDRELARIRAKGPAVAIEALGPSAYNANLLSHGRPEFVMRVTLWQKVSALFA